MRILLIPAKYNYPKPEPDASGFGQGMPYIAGALKAAGHEVFGLNLNYRWCYGSAPLTLEKLIREKIKECRPGLIGLGGLAPDYIFLRDAVFFCRQIAPEIPIVCGGSIITYDSSFIMNQLGLDYGIVGEGELAIVKLAECLENGGGLDDVPSLVYRKQKELVSNPVKYVEDVDTLPLPEYDIFDMETYLSLNNQTNNYLAHTRNFPRILPISIARSCPFKCTFCCHDMTAKYRVRSMDNVMKEAAHFYEKYRFNILYVHDEYFTNRNGKKISEFCRKVKQLKKEIGSDFDWGCYMRINDFERPLLIEMEDAGCKHIGVGFESASNRVLKSMKKGTTAENMLNAIRLAEDAGMGMHANFIFGDVAETGETIKETMEFYDKYCRDLCVYFYYITPYPGSKLFEYCVEKALIADRREYYETVAFQKGCVNMTGIADETFRNLTEPVMSDIYKCKAALVTACEPSDEETCDREAPYELRRRFYRIDAVCPHCSEAVSYLYPLLIRPGMSVKPIIHYCVECHKRFLLDVFKHAKELVFKEDDYSRFYKESPYLNYYPFDASKYAMQAVSTPRLLEAHKAYNLIRYADRIYAIAQSLGSFDLTLTPEEKIDEFRENGACFIGHSVEEVKALIDKEALRRRSRGH